MIDLLLQPIFRKAIVAFEVALIILWITLDLSLGSYLAVSLCSNLIIGLSLSVVQTNRTVKYNIKTNALVVAHKLLNEEHAGKIRVRNYNR